ncbi:MAG: Lrp/AsnC family transcriptional regulator [Breznakia sp.]
MKDLDLLEVIEKNAKVSNQDLATILEKDEAWILETLNDLEKQKIIGGYHTIINWDKTTVDQVTAIIYVDAIPQRDSGYDRLAKRIYNYPEVESMYLTSGSSDFMLMMKARTMKEIANFVATKLACIEGVSATSTLLVLQTYKAHNVIMCEEERTPERLLVTP